MLTTVSGHIMRFPWELMVISWGFKKQTWGYFHGDYREIMSIGVGIFESNFGLK